MKLFMGYLAFQAVIQTAITALAVKFGLVKPSALYLTIVVVMTVLGAAFATWRDRREGN